MERQDLFSATGKAARCQGHALTLRAALIGVAAVVFLSIAAPFTDLFLQNSELSGNHLPLGPMLVLIFLVVLVNGVVRWLGSSVHLQRDELLYIFCMTLVAAGIPTFGLVGYLLPAISSPLYFASPENDYARLVRDYIPSFLLPEGRDAIRAFYEGVRAGDEIPWAAWITPLLVWAVFVVFLFWMMICLSVLIAPCWIEQERLTFPLVQVPLTLTGPRSSRSLARNHLFWAGLAIPVITHTFAALHQYVPGFPELKLKMIPLQVGGADRPWTHLNAFVYLYFSVIGLAYLIPADVSFSIWFFYFFGKLQMVVADSLGYLDHYTRTAESQYAGAFIVFALILLRIKWQPGRGSVSALVRYLMTRERGNQMMSPCAATLGMMVSVVMLITWCWIVGISVSVAVGVMMIFVITCLGLGRIVSESGVLFAKATQMMPLKIMLPLLGSEGVGAGNIARVGLVQYIFMFDLKAFLMPALMHSHRVSSEARLNRRHLLWALVLSLGVAVVVSCVAVLTLAYRHGALTMSRWFFVDGPVGLWNTVSAYIKMPAGSEEGKLLAMIAGGLWVLFLQIMRTRFIWFPFHPVGYVLAYSWETTRVWFACLVGWLFKVAIVRYGGLKGHISARDCFYGLILGEFGIAGVWLVIDAIAGKSGHMVFP
jgi:hypothetical protein